MQKNIGMGSKKSAVTAIHQQSSHFHPRKSKCKACTANPDSGIKRALGGTFVEKSEQVSALFKQQPVVEWKHKIQTKLKTSISSTNENSRVSKTTGDNKKKTIEQEKMMHLLTSSLDFPLSSHKELEITVQNLLKESNLERQITELDVKLPENVTLEQVKRTLRKLSKQISECSSESVNELAVEEKGEESMTSRKVKTVRNLSHEIHDPQRTPSSGRKVKPPPKFMVVMAKRAKPAPVSFSSSSKAADFVGSQMQYGRISQKFSALSPWKKLAAVVVLTVVYATAGILAGQLVSLAFPALAQGIFREFFIDFAVESLRNRSEVNFSLLQLSSEQARPLSRAWRDQFVLCKYI